MKKRLMSLALVLIILLSLVPIGAMATQSMIQNFNRAYTLTGNKATDICRVANAQANRTKSELGYTENWCADFVCDCARLANVPTSVIGTTGSVSKLYSTVMKGGGVKVTKPRAGDLVFYTGTPVGGGESRFIHVGIMTSANTSTQGNLSGIVKVNKEPGKYINTKYDWSLFYVRPNYCSSPILTANASFNEVWQDLNSTLWSYVEKIVSWFSFR